VVSGENAKAAENRDSAAAGSRHLLDQNALTQMHVEPEHLATVTRNTS